MKIIDFHTHVYPDTIALKAANSIREFYSLGNETMDGSVKMLLEKGAAAGTWRYVILPVAVRPENTRHINNFILEQLTKHPEFLGFGTIHAETENLMEEVDHIQKNGLRGIKMHPDFQVFALDDPRLFPMYEQIQGKLPIMLHIGDRRYDYSHRGQVCQDTFCGFSKFKYLSAEKSPNISCLHIS